MGNYKEENGTTRVGDFLRKAKGVAPALLEVAGTVTGVQGLKELANSIKGSNLSPVDKETALKLLEFDIVEAQEVSKRWDADMKSDSWLSKNVRPITLIALTLFTCLVIVSDSKESWLFDVKESYIALLETLLVVVYFAYFGGRTYEKGQKIKK
jgi:hypothetical protein